MVGLAKFQAVVDDVPESVVAEWPVVEVILSIE
jgi:hypothetical protein